jgi:hypothetical protein
MKPRLNIGLGGVRCMKGHPIKEKDALSN